MILPNFPDILYISLEEYFVNKFLFQKNKNIIIASKKNFKNNFY